MNIYIHIPFCVKKCDYCAFYSVPCGGETAQFDIFLEHLEQDILASNIQDRVKTIYIGGGTPTVFTPDALKKLYSILRGAFNIAPDTEITSECNPTTLTEAKADVMAGFINRVSMGVQSFSPDMLLRTGRNTTDVTAGEKAFSILRKAGMKNIGLDLIYAVPGETLEDFDRDISCALELAPSHVSAYSLIVEDNTPLSAKMRRNGVKEVDDSLSADMWELAGERFSAAGMPRYEISSYAPPTFRCAHNMNVWHGEKYTGFGPAACSFDGKDRFTNVPSLSRWLDGTPPEKDSISSEARKREVFMMGLRTTDGWKRDEFDWSPFLDILEELSGDGLLEVTRTSVRPTRRGLLFWNDVAERLIL